MEKCDIKNMITQLIIFWIILPLISSQENCVPGAPLTFRWNYDVNIYPNDRTSTLWTYNTNIIMFKDGELPAELVPGEGFDGRLSEDTQTNAGMKISNVMKNDTGKYDVEVKFVSGPDYIKDETLNVNDSNVGEPEVRANAHIYVNGKETVDTKLGPSPLNFTIILDELELCVPVPSITIHFESLDGKINDTKPCPNTFTCSMYIIDNGNVFATAAMHSYNVRFPVEPGHYEVRPQVTDLDEDGVRNRTSIECAGDSIDLYDPLITPCEPFEVIVDDTALNNPSPIISIIDNDKNYSCRSYSCSHDITRKGGSLYVVVDFDSVGPVRFPETGTVKMEKNACSAHIPCIVPATVVPVGVVLIGLAIGLGIYFKRRRSEPAVDIYKHIDVTIELLEKVVSKKPFRADDKETIWTSVINESSHIDITVGWKTVKKQTEDLIIQFRRHGIRDENWSSGTIEQRVKLEKLLKAANDDLIKCQEGKRASTSPQSTRKAESVVRSTTGVEQIHEQDIELDDEK